MDSPSPIIRWRVIAAVILIVAGMNAVAGHRLRLETDIAAGLPRQDPVLADARYILTHYPVFDRVVIDLGLTGTDPGNDLLLRAAREMEHGLLDSGLFTSVGAGPLAAAMPLLFSRIVSNLPSLFSREDLEASVLPLLQEGTVRSILAQNEALLEGLEGFGQADLIARDPLGLRNLVTARLGSLLPVHDAVIRDHFIVSKDGRHVLIVAEPRQPATDSVFALRIRSLIDGLTQTAAPMSEGTGAKITVTPIGSYRSAIDNETAVRRDTMRALLLSTLGIALLLLISFPRWYIGLLALVPALVGASAALFVMSLLKDSLSILAVGFGGAIISINVDYGIAYLSFLDQAQTTTGTHASRQSFWVGLGASLTTVGSFLALSFSGFPILVEIGQFTALGTIFSFAFVHTIFPLVFARMSPAGREGLMPMEAITTRLELSSGWKSFAAAALIGLVGLGMALFGRPEVRADIESMNTVSADTKRAEDSVRRTWGDVLAATYVLTEGRSVEDLHDGADRLDAFIRSHTASGTVRPGFSPSSVFPGRVLARENEAAWREFWTRERIRSLRSSMARESSRLGFSRDAFTPFFQSLEHPRPADTTIPRELYGLLGISRNRAGDRWMMIGTVRPGPRYDPDMLYKELTKAGIGKMLDARWFSHRLSEVLYTMFVRMGLLCGAGLLVMLVFYYMDARLIALSLAPVAFALVAAFATYRLAHLPLDIPSLLLVVVVFGMGIDYPIYFIGAHQRYGDEHDPAMRPIRTAVFLNAGSTILGLGVLAFAGHTLLRSAGLAMVIGLVYALMGTVALLPPVLRRLYAHRRPGTVPALTPGSSAHGAAVRSLYKYLEPYVRMFARFKILLDPMFPRLAELVGPQGAVLDIGCGYGVPAAWLMTLYPGIRITGIEPDPQRVRVAQRVLGNRGTVLQGKAPDLPPLPDKHETFDTALLLDMIHYLNDEELAKTLRTVHGLLKPGGSIVIRATVPTSKSLPWERRIELWKSRVMGFMCRFRPGQTVTEALTKTGFSLTSSGPSAPGREETWFIARRP